VLRHVHGFDRRAAGEIHDILVVGAAGVGAGAAVEPGSCAAGDWGSKLPAASHSARTRALLGPALLGPVVTQENVAAPTQSIRQRDDGLAALFVPSIAGDAV
jgi:hypothetical protein